MKSNYNKYKDNDPKNTILRIQEILNRAAGLGLDNEGSFNLVSELFGEELASRARAEAEDPDGILKRNFPVMNCYDCENCELNGKGCDNMAEEEIYIKIKEAMKDSRVSQQELLDRLSAL